MNQFWEQACETAKIPIIQEFSNGNKMYHLNGHLHRIDGPAIVFADGSQEWYLNGKLHREDGPALEYVDGTKYWFLNGKRVSQNDLLLS